MKINFLNAYENIFVRSIFLNGYFIFRNLTLPLYEVYLVVVSGGWSVVSKKKGLIILFFIPYVFLLILLVGNGFLHNVFFIDKTYTYTRGPMALAFYNDTLFYIITGFVILFRYKSCFPRDKFISLCTMIPRCIFLLLYPQIKFTFT